jgi:hypothetical protein
MLLALFLVLLCGLWNLLFFVRVWVTHTHVGAQPSEAGIAQLAKANPLWAENVVGPVLLLCALLYPAWAATVRWGRSAATGERSASGQLVRVNTLHWIWPLAFLALVELLGGLGPWLIHLKAPRDSYLWWSQFGSVQATSGFSTPEILLFDGLHRLASALEILGLGTLLLAIASWLTLSSGKPALSFCATLLLLLVGELALQAALFQFRLWPRITIVTAALAAALWVLSLLLLRGLSVHAARGSHP